jgi:hypothetical protein
MYLSRNKGKKLFYRGHKYRHKHTNKEGVEYYYCAAEVKGCSGRVEYDPDNGSIEVRTTHANHKLFTLAEIEVESLKVIFMTILIIF